MAANFDTNLEHPEAYVKYARVYFPVAPDYAINKLKDLLAAQPNSALAQRELAEKYYDNNQLTMAADQYEKYIQNPNSFKRDKQRLVGLLFFAKRYNDSYDLASQILTEEPDNHYMQRLQFYNKRLSKRRMQQKLPPKNFSPIRPHSSTLRTISSMANSCRTWAAILWP